MGGNSGNTLDKSFTDNVDVISLDPEGHPVPPCLRSRKPYPHKVRAAVGASVYGEERDPLVCGGELFPGGATSLCYAYDAANDTWDLKSKMIHNRSWPGASVHPQAGFVITGGLGEYEKLGD